MSIFDDLREKFKVDLSEWIQVVDPRSKWTMNDFEKTGVVGGMVKPHCIRCTTYNYCWFKNEEGKKPKPFGYEKYSSIVLSKLKDIMGLYHPRCHCEEQPIDSPKEKDVSIIKLDEKMVYLFNDKANWLLSMGYSREDSGEVFKLIETLSKKSYSEGNYIIDPPPEDKIQYGFRIKIFIDFPGKRIKEGRIYKIISSYIVYPFGKLRNNTPIGGWAK